MELITTEQSQKLITFTGQKESFSITQDYLQLFYSAKTCVLPTIYIENERQQKAS